MAKAFEESFDLDSDEELFDETKGSQDVTIANASDKAITVQVLPIHMVQQQELSERHFGIGVACDGQLGFQVGHGKAELKNYKTEVQNLTVYPHNVWNVQAPCNSLRKTKKGKGAMIENSIQIRVFLMDNNDAVSDEIGKGYLVGPGHGIVVSNETGRYKVDQTKGRNWYSRFDPWATNQGRTQDPHSDLRKHRTCSVCQFSK